MEREPDGSAVEAAAEHLLRVLNDGSVAVFLSVGHERGLLDASFLDAIHDQARPATVLANIRADRARGTHAA